MSTVEDEVRRLVAPILSDLGLDLYDLEHKSPKLLVTIDRSGGVDLEALTLATRLISRELDHADPIPGRYQLEVSSPGLERRLRTPAHFRSALGLQVALRTTPQVEGDRRVDGVLVDADDAGVVVRAEGGERRLRFDEIDRARTVFEWGAAPKPGGPARRPVRTSRPTPTEADAR